LHLDLARSVWFALGARLPLNLPVSLHGAQLFLQGVVLDPGLGFVLTDATEINFFDPIAMFADIGAVHRLDEHTLTVQRSVPSSANGRIAFTPDRTRAYMTVVSSNGAVKEFDLAGGGLRQIGSVSLSGGARPGIAINRAGTRLYVPLHDGVAAVDVDPASATYDTELRVLPTPITGPAGAIGSGPLAVAVTPDGSRVYIAYGEALSGPPRVGVFDLTQPSPPHTIIRVTEGGNLFGVHTLEDIVVSEDGQFVFTIEHGVVPGFGVSGWQNGAVINVISTATNTEVAAIPTGGYYQHELAIDLLGKTLWTSQRDANGVVEVLRVDVDRRSANRFSVAGRIQLPVPVSSASSGPQGVGITPDGSTVLVTINQTSGDPTPRLFEIDAVTGSVNGPLTTPNTWPKSVEFQRY
jgi:DNA-binding beta-propeller fold protein YncE